MLLSRVGVSVMSGVSSSDPNLVGVTLESSPSKGYGLQRFAKLVSGDVWPPVFAYAYREFRAEAQPAVEGFVPFFRIIEKPRHARRLMSVIAPFFARCLFVALDLERSHWPSACCYSLWSER